jgi:RNA polymerase sigma-70 factor (ECF subfamily)
MRSGDGARFNATQLSQTGSDKSLITAVAAGDKRAMHALYARHHIRVYRFILRLIKNSSLAEDLVSEVFLDVWRNARSFRGKSQVSTWLLAIARNKAISAMRRRSDEQLDEAALAGVEDPADNAQILAEKQDQAAIVRRCLSALSAIHREVLDLVYYHGKSADEIARVIGIPVATVKTRMFYARNSLKHALAIAGVESL